MGPVLAPIWSRSVGSDAFLQADRAILACLEQKGFSPQEIDFLVTTTCTGRLCPSLDTRFVRALGMRQDIQRVHVGDTGCASAVVALQQAFNYVKAHPRGRALVVAAEVCSFNLGTVYSIQGKYADAEPLYKRALAIEEKALGPDHPRVAESLLNLGTVYTIQGKYADAEPLFKRALAIREKALGPDHPHVAQSLNKLAELYKKTGRTNEAKRLEERAKGIRSRNQ